MQTMTSIWRATRDELRAHRALRAQDQRLERELAQYSSPADRAEIDAILSRYPDEAVAPLEGILTRQRAA